MKSRHLIAILSTTIFSISLMQQAHAAAFQLWEQDGASIGNYHAGYAVGEDASTAFYNPAGITQFKNQQIVFGGVAVLTDFKYKGTIDVSTLIQQPPAFTAQGGSISFIPFLHYVAPITDRIGFGFSIDIPFGLKTDYGDSTPLRYAATLSTIKVIDISPSLAFQVTNQFSIGAGFDVQRTYVELNKFGTALGDINDTESKNKLNDTGYGYHLGALYAFSPNTRVGLSYHSQVALHLKGTSRFEGPLADNLNDGRAVESHDARANLMLPAYTALSMYQRVCPQFALLGSAIYTQWDSVKQLTLRNMAGIDGDGFEISKSIVVTVPQYFHNTWNFSVGTEFYANEQITLKAGVGYDQTPVRKRFRNVQIPDADRYVVAIGGHYQATPVWGFDLSYLHVFANSVDVNPPPHASGSQVVSTDGRVKGGADVFAAQVTWNIC